jgi:hypothetical protein
MTEGELAELIRDCPSLFHMAERGAWPAIKRYGLLSTSALLDLYGIGGEQRAIIEAQRRPNGIELTTPGLPRAVIRDQKPMSDRALERCLPDGMVPAAWYRLLNSKVFFWLSQTRLEKLLGAAPYRALEHDVLELDTARFIEAYRPLITLSPINSGSTIRRPVSRGIETFQSISNYPYAEWRRKRSRGDRVVELAVPVGVPDVARFVTRVTRRRGTETLSVLR